MNYLKISMVCGLLIVAFVSWIWGSGQKQQTDSALNTQTGISSAVAASAAQSTTPDLHGSANPPVSGRAEMAQDYLQSRNLRAFIEKAKASPENGGIYYAHRALLECSMPAMKGMFKSVDAYAEVPVDVNTGHEKALAMQNALGILRQRCADLQTDDLIAVQKELQNSRAAKADPIWMLNKKIGESASRKSSLEQQKQLIAEIVDQPLPEVLQNWRGGRYQMPAGLSASGQVTAAEQEAYTLAWRILPCDFGEVCDSRDLTLAVNCYHDSECANSRLELMQRYLERNPQNDLRLAQVIAMKNKIADAIRQKDVAVFVQP